MVSHTSCAERYGNIYAHSHTGGPPRARVQTLKCSFNYPEHKIINGRCQLLEVQFIMYRSIRHMQIKPDCVSWSANRSYAEQCGVVPRAVWGHDLGHADTPTNKAPRAGVN